MLVYRSLRKFTVRYFHLKTFCGKIFSSSWVGNKNLIQIIMRYKILLLCSLTQCTLYTAISKHAFHTNTYVTGFAPFTHNYKYLEIPILII